MAMSGGGSGQSRRELLEVISQQKEQMARYETRLKDVVRAYKGLAKEKETLETSLKVITAAVNEESEKEEAGTDTDCEQGEGIHHQQEGIHQPHPTQAQGPRLAALSSSLAAVTQEKSQSEAKFLADKRKMKKERDELTSELEKLRAKEEEIKTNFEETKSKLIIEKHEREKEINNNKLMMQEMQKLLSEERRQKENLTAEVSSLQSKISSLEDPSKSKHFEHQIRAMQLELESARKQISRSEKQLAQQSLTSSGMAQLREEMADMKRKHWEQLQGAEAARERAELRVLEVQSHQEKRVANLEARLQELSQSVGNYEKLRQQDQSAICCMREEIDVLNSENAELAQTLDSPSLGARPGPESPLAPSSVEDALGQVTTLKAWLLEAGAEVSQLEPVFLLPGQQGNNQLEAKLKHLQLRLQTEVGGARGPPAPSAASAADGILGSRDPAQGSKEEMARLRSVNEELQARVQGLALRCKEQEELVAARDRDLVECKQGFAREREAIANESRKAAAVARLEVGEHRDRCLTLVAEKDQEIQKLREQVEAALEEDFFRQDRYTGPGSRESSKSPQCAPLPRKVSVDSSLDLSSRQEGSMSQGQGPPLHYVQELQRKEVQLKELRKEQFQAEQSLREIQLTMSTKEEKYQDTIEGLEDTIRRLERMTTGEGASQEYLKNVILNYMLSTDIGSKNHMLKAIAAVLRLTEKEVKRVVDHNQAWWWKQQKLGAIPSKK